MAKNTVRLHLHGDVSINEFATAIKHFAGLMNELSEEIAGHIDIDWQIVELEAGSANIGLLGISEKTEEIEKIVAGFGIIGKALQSNSPIPYSSSVVQHAYGVVSIINGHVTSVSFAIEGQTAEINEPIIEEDLLEEKNYEFGTIIGIANSLLRNPFRISIEDALFERAVHCYTPASYEEIMRDSWGKRVSVTGLIYRNPDTGRPERVKSVVDLTVLDDPGDPLQSFAAVSGILPWSEDTEPPEIIIRRLREDDL